MPDLSTTKRFWEEYKSRNLTQVEVTRTALSGDGEGSAQSNLYVTDRPGYIYARETSSGKKFVVLDRGVVGNRINLPIIIGIDKLRDSVNEQVLWINYSGLPTLEAGSATTSIGAHAATHQYGGGDEVYIDPRLFIPGLAYPTSPSSMSLIINQFYYELDGEIKSFASTTTAGYTKYVPNASNGIFILTCVDKYSNSLSYISGSPFDLGEKVTWDALISSAGSLPGLSGIPSPHSNLIPLVATRVRYDSTSLTWSALNHVRYHFNNSTNEYIERISAVENYTGADDSLAVMGAASVVGSGDNRRVFAPVNGATHNTIPKFIYSGGVELSSTNVKIDSSNQLSGAAIIKNITEASANYSVQATDEVIIANASAASLIITLPALSNNLGKQCMVKKVDSTGNVVSIQGTENIDGAASVGINIQYESFTFVGGYSEWHLI